MHSYMCVYLNYAYTSTIHYTPYTVHSYSRTLSTSFVPFSDTNRKRIAAKGGLEAIAIAMDAHSEDGNVQEW